MASLTNSDDHQDKFSEVLAKLVSAREGSTDSHNSVFLRLVAAQPLLAFSELLRSGEVSPGGWIRIS